MDIKIEVIENALNRILDKLKSERINEIELIEDNYWIISADEWADFENEVSPSVGSLYDDLQSLEALTNMERPVAYVDFDRLASLLHYLSEKLNSVDGQPSE